MMEKKAFLVRCSIAPMRSGSGKFHPRIVSYDLWGMAKGAHKRAAHPFGVRKAGLCRDHVGRTASSSTGVLGAGLNRAC